MKEPPWSGMRSQATSAPRRERTTPSRRGRAGASAARDVSRRGVARGLGIPDRPPHRARAGRGEARRGAGPARPVVARPTARRGWPAAAAPPAGGVPALLRRPELRPGDRDGPGSVAVTLSRARADLAALLKDLRPARPTSRRGLRRLATASRGRVVGHVLRPRPLAGSRCGLILPAGGGTVLGRIGGGVARVAVRYADGDRSS